MNAIKMLGSVFVVGTLLGAMACSGSQAGNSLSTTDSVAVEQTDFSDAYLSTPASQIKWMGFKLGGGHDGTLDVAEAKASIREGRLYGGYAVVDMNSLVVTDLEGEMAEKLREHLLNEDFFEAQTYPTAKFELSDIPAEGLHLEGLAELRGNLTLKDVTKNISIPLESVQYDAVNNVYTLKTQSFRINRADWNVKYGSKSFFTGLGDKVIDDEIELSFVLELKK